MPSQTACPTTSPRIGLAWPSARTVSSRSGSVGGSCSTRLMQPRPLEHDRPVIDVRILDDTGRWQQRSAVFADAGTIDALVWAVEAVGQALVGEAALAGVRGIALSRQRGGKPSP